MNKVIVLALIATCLSVAVLAQQDCCLDPHGTAFPVKAFTGNTLTNADCRSYCKEIGYDWAGTKNGNECWCGNTFCNFGELDKASCSLPCSGNPNEKCGGFQINSISATNARYIGCFVDTETRDLSGFTYKVDYPSYCMNVCRSKGYAYAAMQNGNECYCGGIYGRYGAAPASDCKPCAGDNSQWCGGPWRNSVFRL